jgi:hypothetical protein
MDTRVKPAYDAEYFRAREARSKARISSAVLAAIGGGALLAPGGGPTVVIGVGAGERARSIIVDVAEPGDVVTIGVMVMMPMAANILVGLGCDRRSDHGHNKGGGAKKSQSGHLLLLIMQ